MCVPPCVCSSLCTSVPVYVLPCVSPSLYTSLPVYVSSLCTSLPVYVFPYLSSSLYTSLPVYIPPCVRLSLCTSLPVYVLPCVSIFLYTSLPLYIFSVFISFCIFVPSPCVHLLRVYVLLYFCSISLCTSAPRLCPSICLFLYVCVYLCVCLTGCTFCREYIFVSVFPTFYHIHPTECTFHRMYIPLCRVYTPLGVYSIVCTPPCIHFIAPPYA